MAFAIAIDPLTGKTYVAQYLSMHQDSATGTPNDGVTFAANSVGITLTLKDGDSDTVTSNTVDISTHITFLDDGPSVIVPELAVMLNTIGQTFNGSLNEIQGSVSNVNYGVDGGDTHFVLTGLPSNLTSGGQAILYNLSNAGHTLTGYVDTNGVAGYQVGVDTAIFTALLTLDSGVNATTDQYSISMSGTIDGGSQSISFSTNGGYTFIGGNDPWFGFIDSSSQHKDLLITPEVNGVPGSSVNANANNTGVGSGQSIGASESIRLDFVYNLSGTTAKASGSSPGDYSNPVNEDHLFTGHYDVNGVTAAFSSTTGSKISFVAADDTLVNLIPGSGGTGDAIGPNESNTGFVLDSVTAVSVAYNGSTLLINVTGFALNSTHLYNIGGHDFTISTYDANGAAAGVPIGVNVDGVVGGTLSNFTQVGIFTADGYNSLEINYVANDEFKVGGFGTTSVNPGLPVSLNLPIDVVDGDGDTTHSAIGMYLLPSSPTTADHSADAGGTFTVTASQPDIFGSTHNDNLIGDGANNILFGNAGDDILSGGLGNAMDTMVLMYILLSLSLLEFLLNVFHCPGKLGISLTLRPIMLVDN